MTINLINREYPGSKLTTADQPQVLAANHDIAATPFSERGWDTTQVVSRPLIFTVQSSPAEDAFPVMLRPIPENGALDGTTTRFVGRLPAWAVHGKLRVRFTEFTLRGERCRFEFEWVSPIGDDAFRAAFHKEQRRILLSAGGKYLESDIRANGGRSADAKFVTTVPVHDHSPKPGDRSCPISGFKAEPTFAWLIGGQKYWFCCQPCIDEFVLLAKERPEGVKPAERFVR